LTGRDYSEEQHHPINGFAEALLLQQMKIENARRKTNKGEKKQEQKQYLN